MAIASEPGRKAKASCLSQDIPQYQVYLSDGSYIMEMGSGDLLKWQTPDLA
jgi:hypothetical protein